MTGRPCAGNEMNGERYEKYTTGKAIAYSYAEAGCAGVQCVRAGSHSDHCHYPDAAQARQDPCGPGGTALQRGAGAGRRGYLGSLPDQRDLCRPAAGDRRRGRELPEGNAVPRRFQHGAPVRQRPDQPAAVLRQGGHWHPCRPERGHRYL